MRSALSVGETAPSEKRFRECLLQHCAPLPDAPRPQPNPGELIYQRRRSERAASHLRDDLVADKENLLFRRSLKRCQPPLLAPRPLRFNSGADWWFTGDLALVAGKERPTKPVRGWVGLPCLHHRWFEGCSVTLTRLRLARSFSVSQCGRGRLVLPFFFLPDLL